MLNLLKKHRKKILVGIYLALILVLYNSPGVFRPGSVEEVRRWVESYGIWGPVVYVALYTARPVLLFPSLLLNLAAGVLFAPLLGIPLLLAGGLGSALVLFYLARGGMGDSFLDEHGGKWGGWIHRYLSDPEKNFLRMLWLRTVPLFPYDVISLVAGCTRMDLRTFAVSTVIGMVPGAIAYNVLGDALGGEGRLLPSLLLTAAAFGIPLLFWYFGGERRRMGKERTDGKEC